MILNGSNLNDAKKLGRSKRFKDILDIFTSIEEQGFGIRDAKKQDDIMNYVSQCENAKEFLANQGLSVAMFLAGLMKSPVPPKCRKRKVNEENKENCEYSLVQEHYNKDVLLSSTASSNDMNLDLL